MDDRDSTSWQSRNNNHSDDIEWLEVAVPAGRYEQIRLNPRFGGMEMYIAVEARDHGAPGGKGARRRFDERLPQGWVDEGRGHIPGVGIPYVKHVKRVKAKDTVHSFPEWGYILGDNSRIRLYFTNLDYGHHGTKHKNYRAGVQEFRAVRQRTSKEAKREKWILVDDLSDVVKTLFQWCGINDWEVESTGVRLKDKSVFNRSDFLIDILNKAAEQVGYVFYMPVASASSGTVGSRPSWRCSIADVRDIADSASLTCAGTRMVRPLSAMARVMAWRIHHVAYVENLKPRSGSNFSTARMRPRLPSWMTSGSGIVCVW